MLKQSPGPGHVDLFAVDSAIDGIVAEFPVAAERHQYQIDAIGEVFLRRESHLASVAGEGGFVSGVGLHVDVEVVLIRASWPIRVGLELDQGLVQFVHLTIDIDVVLGRPICILVFMSNTFLHNEAESIAGFRDALGCSKVVLHSVGMMAAVHVLSHEALFGSTDELFSLECVLEGFERDSSALPRMEIGQFILRHRLRPKQRFVRPAKAGIKLELGSLGIDRDSRFFFVVASELDLEGRHVEIDAFANLVLLYLDQVLLLFCHLEV